MTIWYVKKLYTSDGCSYKVLPYDLVGTMKGTMKMKNGIRQMLKFLSDSRMTEKAAYSLCEKKNCMKLVLDLKRAEERADREGWIDADDLEKELGVLE